MVDWLGALNLDRAVSNCRYDFIGDWYRDPWGWPELDWALRNSDFLIGRLNDTRTRACALVDVPKTNFATRPALVFDPIDRLCYQATVDANSVSLIGELPPWAFGTRLARTDPVRGLYTSRKEWGWYRERLQALNQVNYFALLTDIVSFFASIPVPNLCSAVEQRARNAIAARTCAFVENWSRIPGRPGLQQRSMASSVLANMYLRPLDDLLVAEGSGGNTAGRYGRALRWTDDIWLFGGDAGELRRAQLRLERCMRDLGLNMNAAKTEVIGGDELTERVFEIELGYVDIALAEEPQDHRPLELVVRKLVGHGESASRTALRFVCKRIRDVRRVDLANQIADAAPRMPQAADYIARMLRELELPQSRVDWYLEYCRSAWASLEWAPAQLATMFPAGGDAFPAIADYFQELLAKGRLSLPTLAVVSQRLASWRPPQARDLIRDLAKSASHPLERRILALTALQAGEDHGLVERLLAEFDDNIPTLRLLRDSDFRVPTLVPDFIGR